MKFKLVYLGYCLAVFNCVLQRTQADMKFTKVVCNSSAVGTCSGLNCNVDKAGTLGFRCSLTRDLPKVYVTIKAFTKVGSNFLQVLKTPVLDWCAAFKGISMSRFMKNYVNYLKEYAPSLVQECPFKGKLELQNLTLDLKYFKFLPDGEFKIIIHVYDKIDENIFTFTYYTKSDNN